MGGRRNSQRPSDSERRRALWADNGREPSDTRREAFAGPQGLRDPEFRSGCRNQASGLKPQASGLRAQGNPVQPYVSSRCAAHGTRLRATLLVVRDCRRRPNDHRAFSSLSWSQPQASNAAIAYSGVPPPPLIPVLECAGVFVARSRALHVAYLVLPT